MKAYAQIASKGTYKPASGPEMPAVTNLPPGEDPLMRSLEYTVASADARDAGSEEGKRLSRDVALGADLLKGVATKGLTTGQDTAWQAKQQKLALDVAAALTFTYDPTVSSGPSTDGSSSKGRFLVVHNNKKIATKAEFQAAMLAIAVASLGFIAGSDEARSDRDQARSRRAASAEAGRTLKRFTLEHAAALQRAPVARGVRRPRPPAKPLLPPPIRARRLRPDPLGHAALERRGDRRPRQRTSSARRQRTLRRPMCLVHTNSHR